VGANAPHLGSIGNELFPGGIATNAFRTERLAACAFAEILAFDVIARVAFGVVVVHRLFHRVPSSLLRHNSPYLLLGKRLFAEQLRYGKMALR
jgi:hypothetical protein